MKTILTKIIVVITMTLSMVANENRYHLFILSGQSNMVKLKPKNSFTPEVEARLGKDHVIVVKDASGGQPIHRWYKDWKDASGESLESTGDLYDRLMEKVFKTIEGKELETITFVWMQGERDALEELGHVYKESLYGLVNQLHADLKRKDINVVIGRLSDCDLENKKFPHWTMIRDIQMEITKEKENWDWVDTDDFNGPTNDLHLTKDGYKLLGVAFARKALELIEQSQQKH